MFLTPTMPPSITFEMPDWQLVRSSLNRARQPSAAGYSRDAGTSGSKSGIDSDLQKGTDPFWSASLNYSATTLRNLKPGWDGYGSRAIASHTLFLAETIVRSVLEGQRRAVAPYLVPGGDGSVQVEWHELHGELELSIDSAGELYIWVRSHLSGQEFEGEGAAALDLFARWAPRLASSRNNAVDVSSSTESLDLIAA